MPELSKQQFSQPTLPMSIPAQPEPKLREKPKWETWNRHDPDLWSNQYHGPIPGQMVMGVKNLGGDAMGHPSRLSHQNPFYEVDRTGMVQDAEFHPGQGLERGKWISPVDIASNRVKNAASKYYRFYGGALAGVPRVDDHWAAQPKVYLHPDTPIHTNQSPEETLHGDSMGFVGEGKGLIPEHFADGRRRINKIRTSMQRRGKVGLEPIEQPAWVMKHSGRLYALDGHHRIAAAREEGQHIPVHLWDLDAEEGWK